MNNLFIFLVFIENENVIVSNLHDVLESFLL